MRRCKEIPLTRGMVALVNVRDYAFFSAFCWCAKSHGRKKFCAVRFIRQEGKRTCIFMHREVLRRLGKLTESLEVDHKNGNSLDNRRRNLRPATESQNCANRKELRDRKSSTYRGVSTRYGGWIAQIRANNRTTHLGSFQDPILAARAYDAAARQQFGEFANLNNV